MDTRRTVAHVQPVGEMTMPNLYDLLFDCEHRLEQARNAGNPNAVHVLDHQRRTILAQIEGRTSPARGNTGPHGTVTTRP